MQQHGQRAANVAALLVHASDTQLEHNLYTVTEPRFACAPAARFRQLRTPRRTQLLRHPRPPGRAERRTVHLTNSEDVSAFARKYLNRLSDLLFALGRALNKAGGRGDVQWVHGKNRATSD